MLTDLSISIVAYRKYDDIKYALKTMEKCTNSNIKKDIYIVDNSGFPDHFALKKEFKEFVRRYSDVKYVDTKRNLGYGSGHNYIIPSLNSRYHCIMNPDIVFIEDAFKAIISFMDSNSDIGMIIPNIVDEQGRRQLVYRKEPTIFDMFIRMFCQKLFIKRIREHTLQYEDYSKPFQVPFGQGSFLVIRTDLLKKINGFDEHYFMYLEDADLCKRVNQVSKLMYFPNATIIHKWERGSHRDKTLFKYHIKSMKYYFDKWGYKWF